jgi:hypothetical protein
VNESSNHTLSLHRPTSNYSSALRRLNSPIQSPVWSGPSYRLSLYRLRTNCTGNISSDILLGRNVLPRRCLAIEVYCCGADHIENTSTVLLTACVCWTAYRTVAWQRVDQICYPAPSLRVLVPSSLSVHYLSFLSEVSAWFHLTFLPVLRFFFPPAVFILRAIPLLPP